MNSLATRSLNSSLYPNNCDCPSPPGTVQGFGQIYYNLFRYPSGLSLLRNDLPGCTGNFTITFGLPCVHALEPLLCRDQPLQLEHFHTQWHLQRDGIPQLILEPQPRFDTVTARSKLPITSTQRELSALEAVEATSRTRALPTCSSCREQGHRMTSKVYPLRHESLLRPSAPSAVTSRLIAASEPILLTTAST